MLGNYGCYKEWDELDEYKLKFQADNSSSGELAGGQTEPQETASRPHTFKNKSFKKSKICGICKQVIDSQGISCRGE
ncbi:tensin-3 [Grus japonensis]|uniref:Tensin-3 n=1 Tax=Grus japonensis TaxID=30415 RepID=A0ABC9WEV8_GRUJA